MACILQVSTSTLLPVSPGSRETRIAAVFGVNFPILVLRPLELNGTTAFYLTRCTAGHVEENDADEAAAIRVYGSIHVQIR